MNNEKAIDGMAIDITPDLDVIKSFKHYEYEIWEALAEYVDNSVQSYINCKNEGMDFTLEQTKVTVDIVMTPEAYLITDDAGGIPESRFSQAFKSGKRPPNNPEDSLSEFGLGMKTASIWFADKWTVETKAYGEENIKTVEFDMNNLTNIIKPIIEKAPDVKAHYTHINLYSPNKPYGGKTLTKIRQHLSHTFRKFIEDGSLAISVTGKSQLYNGEINYLEVPEINFLKAPEWSDNPPEPVDGNDIDWIRKIDFTLRGVGINGEVLEYVVQGKIWIAAVGDTEAAGLTLFRRNRVIQGDEDAPYRPKNIYGGGNSYQRQRLFGEIYFPPEMPVTHTKTKIVFPSIKDVSETTDPSTTDGNQPIDIIEDKSNSLEDQFHEKLYEAFIEEPNFIRQSKNYRAKKETRTVINSQIDIMKVILAELKKSPDFMAKLKTKEDVLKLMNDHLAKPPVESSPHRISINQEDISDGNTTYSITLRTHSDDLLPFITLSHEVQDSNRTSITISINTDDPFYRAFGDSGRQVLMTLAYSIGLAFAKTEELYGSDSVEIKTFLSLINKYLKEIMSKAPRWITNEYLV